MSKPLSGVLEHIEELLNGLSTYTDLNHGETVSRSLDYTLQNSVLFEHLLLRFIFVVSCNENVPRTLGTSNQAIFYNIQNICFSS